MNKRFWFQLVSLAGAANGIWMLILHIRYDKLGSVCAVNEKISCEVLTYRQYSEWLGVPTPLYAFFTFVVLSILAFRGWKKIGSNQVREDVYAWFLSSVSLCAAIAMAYISFVVLKKLCIFCLLFYIIIVAAWLLSKFILRDYGPRIGEMIRQEVAAAFKNQWMWFTGVAFACTITFAHFLFQTEAKLSSENVTIQGDSIKTTGNPNARVTLVIFSDFQCPACKHAAEVLRTIEETYASRIKIVYKFFPLDPSCNAAAPYGQHLTACDAAKAALCAGQQGKFWRFHDRLFANQTSLYEKKFYEFAELEGLNVVQFSACYDSDEALETVKKDAKEGATLEIGATPTIYLNGKKYEGRVMAEDLEKMIESLL